MELHVTTLLSTNPSLMFYADFPCNLLFYLLYLQISVALQAYCLRKDCANFDGEEPFHTVNDTFEKNKYLKKKTKNF